MHQRQRPGVQRPLRRFHEGSLRSPVAPGSEAWSSARGSLPEEADEAEVPSGSRPRTGRGSVTGSQLSNRWDSARIPRSCRSTFVAQVNSGSAFSCCRSNLFGWRRRVVEGRGSGSSVPRTSPRSSRCRRRRSRSGSLAKLTRRYSSSSEVSISSFSFRPVSNRRMVLSALGDNDDAEAEEEGEDEDEAEDEDADVGGTRHPSSQAGVDDFAWAVRIGSDI